MQNDNLSNNGVNEIGANSEGLSPGRSPPAQQRGSGRHHATAGIKIGRKKWEKEVNKVVIECWIRSDPTTRRCRKRMKKIWDEKGLFQANEQRIVDQARMIRVNGWLTEIEIEDIRRRIEGAGEQEHENEDEEQAEQYDAEMQETYTHISFLDEERLLNRAQIAGFEDEEKELLKDVINNIRNNPDKNPPNLRYIERKKVKVATNKISKVISIIRTENITETNTLIKAAANCVADMAEYKQRETNDKREPHWRRRILEKQKKLRKDLGQISRMKRHELHKARTKEKLKRTYHINEKSIEVVHEVW